VILPYLPAHVVLDQVEHVERQFFNLWDAHGRSGDGGGVGCTVQPSLEVPQIEGIARAWGQRHPIEVNDRGFLVQEPTEEPQRPKTFPSVLADEVGSVVVIQSIPTPDTSSS